MAEGLEGVLYLPCWRPRGAEDVDIADFLFL